MYAKTITDEMESSAKARGTGIAKRSPEYIEQKIDEGKAVIALTNTGEWVGFVKEDRNAVAETNPAFCKNERLLTDMGRVFINVKELLEYDPAGLHQQLTRQMDA